MHIIFRIILYTAWISLTSYGIYYQYSKNIEFERNGVHTKAKIIDFSRSEDDEGNVSYYPILDFRDTLENLIEFESSISDFDHIVGDSLEIIYLKNSPRKAIVTSFLSFYNTIIVVGIFLVLGVIFMIIDFYISISKWRKEQKSVKEYKKVDTNFHFKPIYGYI